MDDRQRKYYKWSKEDRRKEKYNKQAVEITSSPYTNKLE